MGRPSSVLRGRVAVVTGSTRGIGLMIAASLAQAGASVTICGRRSERVEQAYRQFEAIPGVQVLGLECDVREAASVERLAEQATSRFGAIDIWFNNAAVTGPLARAGEVSSEEWQQVIDTNLVGTFHGTREALRRMVPRNSGKIINLVGGVEAGGELAVYLSAYAASQAGVLRFTKTVAQEYGDTELSILALAPGWVDAAKIGSGEARVPDAEAHLQKLHQTMNRSGTSLEEIGELAVHMASSETDGVTGRVYEIKGGVAERLKGLFRRG